ncbi:sodium/glucose cotransporter 5-like [Lingula anatina]|uniref:Sodium/glucose cotransporter 5-like n=1 Tax=Lingula anatina TaxID=7574 RepID=A0A1S3JSP6_LINAN|nr:sodium/glucose cotransporter 5-like [Lingula anatina]|eukprot:XP_013413373.1 sodium/glucose cotransporter 5-like [Lingula anatina]
MEGMGLTHWGDILAVVAYFVFVLAVGIWSICRPSTGNVKGYFLAGRDMVWWPVGASLFASNIGSEHFIGLAGAGAASGIAISMYELNAIPNLIILSWIFYPIYVAAGVFTMPEYMEKRFSNQRLRIYLSVLALVLYIFTKIAVSIYAGALFIGLALGWNMYLSIAVLLTVTGAYTVLGGLTAVIYTDTLQTVIMLVGSVSLTVLGFERIGGYQELVGLYMNATPAVRDGNSSCGQPRDDAFHLFRDPVQSDNPWPGLIVQSSLGVLWYFSADQVMVQRVLAARNITHAKGGAILSSYLKILPLFLILIPGMMSRALFPDEVACVDPDECLRYCGNRIGCSNIAYPKLVLTLPPTGMKGLLLAVMLSAIMSSLTSVFNSASALFTMDLWRRLRPLAHERELLIVGRVFIVVLCGVSILWIPLVQSSQGGTLFNYIQAVQGYLGTPISALFLLAIFWKRMTEKGAFCGILSGHICGIIRMAMDFSLPAPQCGEEETRPAILYKVHYTYFGMILIIITTGVTVIVSLVTRPVDQKELAGLTWWTRKETPVKRQVPSPDRQQYDTVAYEARDADDNGDVTLPEIKTRGKISVILVGGDTNKDSTEDDSSEQSIRQRCLHLICGVPKNDHSVEEPVGSGPSQNELNEPRKLRMLLNINAGVACVVLAVLWIIFR